ncbi:hypothetical protein CsatB_015075 [Cannabis sativa]
MIKIVDGATFEAENAYGTGLIIRDSNGAIILATTTYSTGSLSAPMAEMMSIKEDLSWIKASNLSNIIIENDCLIAIQVLHSLVDMPSIFGYIVQECKLLLSSFNNVNVYHIKRSANKATHYLARGSCYWFDRSFTESTIPTTLQSFVIADLAI